MCSRLKELVENHLKLSVNDIAKTLGYANTTVIRKAWKGETFPDTEKLVPLAMIENKDGAVPNIHWVITGQGAPLIPRKKGRSKMYEQLNSVIASLPAAKAKSLLSLLER